MVKGAGVFTVTLKPEAAAAAVTAAAKGWPEAVAAAMEVRSFCAESLKRRRFSELK